MVFCHIGGLWPVNISDGAQLQNVTALRQDRYDFQNCNSLGHNRLAPLIFALCTLVSWALRPQSRVLGTLSPLRKAL